VPYKRKTDNPIKGRPPLPDTEVTSELLVTSQATIAQLAQLFETDAKTLPRRMKTVLPRGTRKGNKVYSIREAAQFIVTPGYEIEEFIRQMSPQELPPLLQKEFWNGQRARLEYETKMGMHWPTPEVISFVGELANTIRMTLLLVADDVNREQSLTDGQRKVFQRITDGAIARLKQEIAKRFEEYHAHNPDPGIEDAVNIVASDDDDDDGNILAAEDDEEEGI
jgi:hypothetical protein